MANTPFLDLVKPAGTDHALVSVINSNSDKIDGGVSTLSDQIGKFQPSTVFTGDLNTLTTTGIYYCGSSCTNLPDPGNYYFVHSDFNDTNNGVQFAFRRSSSDGAYFRRKSNGTWTGWQQLATVDQMEPTAYTSPTMSTGVTLVSGGYIKVGKMVFVSMRMTLDSDAQNICSGLPAPLSSSSVASTQGVVALASNTTIPSYIQKNGTIMFASAVSSSTLIVSGAYICV